MFNFDYITKEEKQALNPNWPEIHTELADHPYRILIAGGFVSRKTNALINLF